ncbi:hypothetical protein F5Y17DRAFT_14980 [Xylariaceae sp. FL0594]|nr:hypothetical protein F5Y17DRAFT_14980 [Xylariaceae sp. FL0594]
MMSLSMQKRATELTGRSKLIIVLSTVFGFLGVLILGMLVHWILRRLWKPTLFNRGLTPIGDDEIEAWRKGDRSEEKEMEAGYDRHHTTTRTGHTSKDSTTSAKIQYQKPGVNRPSTEAVMTPRSFIGGGGYHAYSLDLPRAPEPAAFALAPNARSGLTDEMVPGDDPFVQPLRRQPSRLQKIAPGIPKSSSRGNSQTRASRSYSQPDSMQSSAESSPIASRGHVRVYSSSSVPPPIAHALNQDPQDDSFQTGLSPPPARRQYDLSTIGQALG